jgi:hypothetical protein
MGGDSKRYARSRPRTCQCSPHSHRAELFGLDTQEVGTAHVSRCARVEFPCLAGLKVVHLIHSQSNSAPRRVKQPETDLGYANRCSADIGQRPHHLIATGRYVPLNTERIDSNAMFQRLAGKGGR